MRNSENSYDSRINNGNTDWDSLGEDEFKLRQVERMQARADRRYEEAQKSKKAMRIIAALVFSAVLAITGAVRADAGGRSLDGMINMERVVGETQTFYVNSVTLVDGPNIRSNPWIPDREDGSNIAMDFGEKGQEARVPYQGEAYYYCNEYDPNGGWYGFPAEAFAECLYENAFISGDEAEQLAKKNIVWINEEYMVVDRKEATQN